MKEQKVALVTGAATGIGKACAEALATRGFIIAANYRSRREEAEQMLATLDGTGHQLFQADVSEPTQASRMVDEVVSSLGRIDVLVNAAGQVTNQTIDGDSFSQWQQSWQHSMALNLMGPVNLAFLAARSMIKRGSGRIINKIGRAHV